MSEKGGNTMFDEWHVAKYFEDESKKTFFLLMATTKETRHLYASVFMHYIARYYGVDGAYTIKYSHYGVPVTDNLVPTKKAIASIFPEAGEYDLVKFVKLDADFVAKVVEVVEENALL